MITCGNKFTLVRFQTHLRLLWNFQECECEWIYVGDTFSLHLRRVYRRLQLVYILNPFSSVWCHVALHDCSLFPLLLHPTQVFVVCWVSVSRFVSLLISKPMIDSFKDHSPFLHGVYWWWRCCHEQRLGGKTTLVGYIARLLDDTTAARNLAIY